MGLIIKRNDDGLYNLVSSFSDEQLHDEEWITEDEVKKLLIERAFCDFVEKVIEIDMEFPSGYSVNDKRVPYNDNNNASRFFLDAYGSNYSTIIINRYNEVIDKLKLTLPKLD